MTDTATDRPRSTSRGRDVFSSGRGGVGNIRRNSKEPSAPAPEPQVPYVIRGRERQPAVTRERAKSTGRGGVGNIRSPSRSLSKAPNAQNQTITEEADVPSTLEYQGRTDHAHNGEAQPNVVHSTGRGGLGNISRTKKSKSTSREPANTSAEGEHVPPVHSTGRGGRGNLVPDEPSVDGSAPQA